MKDLASRELVSAVIKQALSDLKGQDAHESKGAKKYFNSVGFENHANLIGINATAVREKLSAYLV